MNRLIGIALLWLGLATAASAQDVVVYYHTDALGTPVAVTDEHGDVIERNEYEPYGLLLNRQLEDGPGFTGHVSDAATRLSYMQQRYYDPQIGRFLSVDPVTPSPSNGENFNRYKYAGNSPYNFRDPDGRQECRSCEAAYGAASSLVLTNEQRQTWANGEAAASTAGSGAEEGAATMDSVRDFIANPTISKDTVVRLGAAIIAARIMHGRAGKQFRGPDPRAGGAHTRIRTDAEGSVTHYETYDSPQPGLGKRVDVVGPAHGDVPTPHVVDTRRHTNPRDPSKSSFTESKPRPARDDEVPAL